MGTRAKITIGIIGILLSGFMAHAASIPDKNDSISTAFPTNKNNGLINKVLAYFDDSNKENEDKKFDFSVIGGPHYSSDTQLGLGLVAAGLYHNNDKQLPPSNISIYSDVSTIGFYLLGVRGTHLFPQDRFRLNYNLYFYSFPSKYWGYGYDNAVNDHNESEYDRNQSRITTEFLISLGDKLYIGPVARFDYVKANDTEIPELWSGQSMQTTNFGLGFSFLYDTRDHLTNAYKGMYVKLDQRFNPRFLGNKYAFSTTEFTINYYHEAWKDAVIACQFHTLVNYGNTPWGLMASFGGSYSMRGYYDGRYNDKCEMDATIELRQHVWRRNGIVVWTGAGTIFPKFSQLRSKHILPNYGIGYRWEFKKRVNVRLDLGFGKGQTGFIFNINEAF